jgi:hypothetical protein
LLPSLRVLGSKHAFAPAESGAADCCQLRFAQPAVPGCKAWNYEPHQGKCYVQSDAGAAGRGGPRPPAADLDPGLVEVQPAPAGAQATLLSNLHVLNLKFTGLTQNLGQL